MKKIIAISLALLMLASNLGLAMTTHFCGGHAVKTAFSLGLKELDCGMAQEVSACEVEMPSEDGFTQKNCCENQSELLELDEEATLHSSDVSPLAPPSLIAFVHVFIQPLIAVEQPSTPRPYYPPPIPDKDIQVLFQVFLI